MLLFILFSRCHGLPVISFDFSQIDCINGYTREKTLGLMNLTRNGNTACPTRTTSLGTFPNAASRDVIQSSLDQNQVISTPLSNYSEQWNVWFVPAQWSGIFTLVQLGSLQKLILDYGEIVLFMAGTTTNLVSDATIDADCLNPQINSSCVFDKTPFFVYARMNGLGAAVSIWWEKKELYCKHSV